MLTNDCNCGLLKCKQRYKRTIYVRTASCLICISHPGTSTAYALRRYKANNWERRNAPLHYRIWSRETNVSVDQQTPRFRARLSSRTCAIFISRVSKFEFYLASKIDFCEPRNLVTSTLTRCASILNEYFKGSRYQYFSYLKFLFYFVKILFRVFSTITHPQLPILISVNFIGIANYFVYCSCTFYVVSSKEYSVI